MTLGPSRRSKNRLAPATTSSSSSLAHNEIVVDRYPTTPTQARRYRDGTRPHRKAGLPHHHTSVDHNDAWKSSRRRTPFIIWMTVISIYCCIMYLHMTSYRTIGQSPRYTRTIFYPNDGNSRALLDEDGVSQLTQKESLVTKLNNGNTNAIIQDRDHSLDGEIVHIVETRFMQKQSRLLELGLARLVLFQTFCLPSMFYQTSNNFIWIIRADPNLHPAIVDTMVQLMEGKKNFVLLGSNSNPEGFGRTKSPFSDFLQDAVVWSGNISLVEEAYEKSAAGAVLLETRLDADDGVNINFIETVQMEASKNLVDSDNAKESKQLWRLWCIHSTIEWHPFNPYPITPEIAAANQTMPEGYLVIFSDKRQCFTPGLTFGYGFGASRASLGIDHLRHDEINKKIKHCKNTTDGIEVECVSRLTELAPGGAFRARTTTSAGMKNVLTGDETLDSRINPFKRHPNNKKLTQQYFKQKPLWALIARDFAVYAPAAISARSTIMKRMQFIAEDNIKGQCTAGHSCKNSTKALLMKISEVESSDDDDGDD
mmetsp:Transcript_31718/g.58086  ORF Transcript_31718/g.58086 Transcript_31718/m.58086 type:complete len:539 (-) Transcript_31718:1183-2799(-)|eukprot:CAMPEP_0201636160 /NCGR_PEP_ID=MMETSP0493-20130528/8427_1 /ASSEMBLY_ACC=CAM_ASM_000838 /TAXON_ID=420259 /ORGANISM="Thalassiosira gravida, Strain GMp14c1" /LENGTH=538 /DNA_ID=CAMNT_0048108221 /DNA_START=103 /DNA_END=1719 /DNA_ORIENTATION=-